MSAAVKRQRRRRSHDQLLDELGPLVLRDGLAEFSLRSAASELGTSHKVLLHHFGSRAGLLIGLLRRIRERMLAETQGPDVVESLERTWRWYDDHPAETRALAQGLALGILEPEALGQTAHDNVAQYLEAVEIDSQPQLRFLLATMRGLLIDRIVTGDREGTDAAFEVLRDFVARELSFSAD